MNNKPKVGKIMMKNIKYSFNFETNLKFKRLILEIK